MASIFITGANRGLGFEFARQYAADGWQVVATCRRPGDAAKLAELGVDVVALDVTDFAAIVSLAERLGGRAFDVLLNNAGAYGERQDFGELDAAEWERVLRINVIGPLKIAEAFLPHLAAGQRKVMAFLTSRMGSIGDNTAGGSYIYRSSKAALNAAVKCLAIELKPRGITAVVLHPGWVKTDMGGAAAPLRPTESVTGLRQVISGLRLADSGSFLDYTGATVPW